jgi:hypothetical protein
VRGLCPRHYEQWRREPTNAITSSVPDGPRQTGYLPVIGSCRDECDVSWLSGLLEGEGTFGIAAHRAHTYPQVSVEMCSEDVVRRASRILGAVAVRERQPADERWSITHITRISGHQAAEWMRRLRGRMGARSSAAMDAALAGYHPIRLIDAPVTCVVPTCGRPHRARGLCNTHYMTWSRDLARGRPPRVTPLR